MNKLKFLISSIIVVILLFSVTLCAYASPSSDLQVIVNGDIAQNVQTYIKDSRTMIPFRYIFESLEAEVSWISETRTVTATKGDISISLQIDNRIVQVNGEDIQLDVAAEIVNSRTYVPLRFVGESLGAEVLYVAKTKSIYISEEFYGNTKSNLVNHGMVFSGDKYDYIATSNGLMQYTKELGEEELLLDSYVEGLNKAGNHLYFVNKDGINRFNLITRQLELLCDDTADLGVECLTIYNNWIYFIGEGDAIYKMRFDGTGHTAINRMGANDFFIYKDKVYFGNGSDDCKLYRMNLDGSNVEKFCDIYGAYTLTGIGKEEWIYFIAGITVEESIYRMRIDGSELELVADDVTYFGLIDNSLVFIRDEHIFDFSGNEPSVNGFFHLFRMDLADNTTEELYFAPGWAYDVNFYNDGFFFGVLAGNNDNSPDVIEGVFYYSFDVGEIQLYSERPEYPRTK